MVHVHASFDVTTGSESGVPVVSPVRMAVRKDGQSFEEVRYTDFLTLSNILLDDDRVPPLAFGSTTTMMVVLYKTTLRVARFSKPRPTVTYMDGSQRPVPRTWWLWVLTLKPAQGSWGLAGEQQAVRVFEISRRLTYPRRMDHFVYYRAPGVGNIHLSGAVCWADVWPHVARLKVDQTSWDRLFDDVERIFWESGFNGDLRRQAPWIGPTPLLSVLKEGV